jgi:predicted nucleotidyltransferase component of viral defense system
MPLSVRQYVEAFHLVFLRALAAKGEDKSLFVLKGGCNLRFFFHSIRYSEDMDLDVRVVTKETLRNKIDRLLQSPAVVGPLKTLGIEIVETSAPKQTETTQRWKTGLRAAGVAVPLRTKIEFSRRESATGSAFEAVDRQVVLPYALTPFLAAHYSTAAAIAQKVHALSARPQPQARDIFDLNLLFSRPDAAATKVSAKEKRWLPRAVEHAMSISFDEYTSQVVGFLDPTQKEIFDKRGSWDLMQSGVVEQLESLQ